MKDQTQKSCTSESDQTDQYIWHSPLLQAVATLRASGQMFCADACQELFTLLHTYDPTERSEYLIAYRLIAKVGIAEKDRSDAWRASDERMAQHIEFVKRAAIHTGSSTSTGGTTSASTAGSGQQRRHCSQAAPLGGGIRSDPFDGGSEPSKLNGRKRRFYDSYGRSILLPM